MGRRVKNTNLDTRTSRLKLKPRPKPYWSAVERGLHLGYRRPTQPIGGTWIVRFYLGAEKYAEEGIGVADDYTALMGSYVSIFGRRKHDTSLQERTPLLWGRGEPPGGVLLTGIDYID
jgi:hypothetical protein